VRIGGNKHALYSSSHVNGRRIRSRLYEKCGMSAQLMEGVCKV
jgi:hypothetical protein